jgi:hypothetical protein
MAHSSRSGSWLSGTAPLLAAAALSLGCATLPMTGVAATGEPLLADVHSENVQFVGKAKVGEVVSRDNSGRVVGTSEVYEDQLMSYNITQWQVFQGANKIDDEDFFRIGGDLQAAEQIARGRDRAVITNRVGWVLLGVGVAALATGLVLQSTLKQKDETGFVSPSPIGSYLAIGGGVVGVTGGALVFYSNAAAHREHPLDDPRRAKRVERAYNKRLGAAPEAAEEPDARGKRLKRRKGREGDEGGEGGEGGEE